MKMRYLPQTLLAIGTMSIMACSTPEKAAMPSDADPRAELTQLQEDQKDAVNKQYDRLSPDNFAKSKKYSSKAFAAFEDNEKREDVLENVAISRRFLENAQGVGEKYTALVTPILDARRFAIDAQAQRFVKKDFEETDEDFADLGEDMESDSFSVNASTISGLEGEYRRHETEAIKMATLDGARQNLQRAEDDGARRNTPKTLEMTRALVLSAERAIESSPRYAAGYQAKVDQANEQSQKLREVLAITKNRDANEGVALTIWEQSKQLQAGKQKLQNTQNLSAEQQAALQSELNTTEATLSAQGQRLTASQQQAATLAERQALTAKIEELRRTFSKDEAEVLKEGQNLVIRLKKMDFKSGQSALSPASFETLQKIQGLIAAVPAQSIVVEGHTDSTGSNILNEALSQKRADSVKEYLTSQSSVETPVEAKGYGAQRPLMTNKTKEGRATNRRVDVVIETSTVL